MINRTKSEIRAMQEQAIAQFKAMGGQVEVCKPQRNRKVVAKSVQTRVARPVNGSFGYRSRTPFAV